MNDLLVIIRLTDGTELLTYPNKITLSESGRTLELSYCKQMAGAEVENCDSIQRLVLPLHSILYMAEYNLKT